MLRSSDLSTRMARPNDMQASARGRGAMLWRLAGFFIVLMPVVFYVTKTAGVVLQLVFLAAAGCLIAASVLDRHKVSPAAWILVTTYGVVGIVSILMNSTTYRPGAELQALVLLLNAVVVLTAGAFATARNPNGYVDCTLEVVALGTAAFLVFGLITGWNDPRVGDRFQGNGLHPNWWGSIAFGAGCAALFVRNRWLQLLVFAVALLLCIQASSRGSMMGLFMLVGFAALKALRLSGRKLTLAAALGMILFAASALTPVGGQVLTYFANDLFQANNTYRGTTTGFTGREDGWRYALELFAQNPIVGVGFGKLPEVHNGYLILLGEMGLVGLLAYLAMTITAIGTSRADARARFVVLAYAVFVLFAPRSINLVLGSLIPSLFIMQGSSLIEKRGSIQPALRRGNSTPYPASPKN